MFHRCNANNCYGPIECNSVVRLSACGSPNTALNKLQLFSMAWTDSFQLGRSVYDPKRYRLDFRFDASCTPSILGYLLLSLSISLYHTQFSHFFHQSKLIRLLHIRGTDWNLSHMLRRIKAVDKTCGFSLVTD